jgi:hypothetical protein
MTDRNEAEKGVFCDNRGVFLAVCIVVRLADVSMWLMSAGMPNITHNQVINVVATVAELQRFFGICFIAFF